MFLGLNFNRIQLVFAMQGNKLASDKRVQFNTQKRYEITLQASNHPHDLLNKLPCLI